MIIYFCLMVNFLTFTYLGIPGYVTKILSRDESTIIVNKTGTNNQQLRGNLD